MTATLAIVGSGGLATAQSTRPVPDCKVSHLTVTPDPSDLTTAPGQRAMTFSIGNRSKSTCKIEGVPDVAFLDKQNASLPVHVCSNCPADLFPVQPVQTVVLNQNEAAYLVVAYTDIEGNQGCRQAATLTVRIGRQGRPVRIRLDGLRTCGVVDVTPFLSRPLTTGTQSADTANR